MNRSSPKPPAPPPRHEAPADELLALFRATRPPLPPLASLRRRIMAAIAGEGNRAEPWHALPWPSPRLAAAALLLAAALGVALGLRLPLEAEADLVELAAVGALGDEPGLEPP